MQVIISKNGDTRCPRDLAIVLLIFLAVNKADGLFLKLYGLQKIDVVKN